MKVLMAEVNFSEGKDLEKVAAIKDALLSVEGINIIDENTDPNHNRTVFTYLGEPEAVLEGTKRLSKKAIELIDMTQHQGSHPRMGAVDVVPFIPVKNMTGEEAVEIAKEYGDYMGGLGIPIYFYEDAQDKEYRKTLPRIRKGQYEGLAEKIILEEWKPDRGPQEFVPKSGATVTGSRFALVAFNVNLDSQDLEIGKKIVRAIRGATGGFSDVRAIALELEEKNQIQVSMNLVNYTRTPIHRVYEVIKMEAERYGCRIVNTELIGPVPVYAMTELLQFYIKLDQEFTGEQFYK